MSDKQARAIAIQALNGNNKLKLLKPSSLSKLPGIMSSPPTVTVVSGDNSGLTNPVSTYAVISDESTELNKLFHYMGDMYRSDWDGSSYSGAFPLFWFAKNAAITGMPGNVAGNLDVEFIVDDISFEIMVHGRGQGTSWRVLIDEGQGYQSAFADPAPVNIPNDASMYWIKLVFSTRTLRRVRFQSADCGFRGVTVGGNGTLLPPTRPKAPKVLFFGDSFTEGTGATGWFNGYAPLVGQMLGGDYWISGSGGTGYVAPNTALGRVKYQDRIQHDVIGYDPDVVVIQGGQNDTIYTKANVQAAADLLYKTLKAGLPNVPIISIGPIAVGAMTTAVTDTRDAIKTAALSNGIALIDSVDGITYDFNGTAVAPATGNWLTGTGNISAPISTGNRSIYTWTDNGHPSNAGHRYIGERVAGETFKLLNLF